MIRKVLSVLGGLLVLAAVLVVINSLHVGRYQVVVDHGKNWVYKIDTLKGQTWRGWWSRSLAHHGNRGVKKTYINYISQLENGVSEVRWIWLAGNQWPWSDATARS